MYFPRRHRRKLFFPPGLLALAFLLLLGCTWVSGDARLKPTFVTTAYFPTPESSAYDWTRFYRIKKENGWKEYYISEPITDSTIWQSLYNDFVYLSNSADSSQRMKIRFSSNTKYEDLIKTLSIAELANSKSHVVDFTGSTINFYITEGNLLSPVHKKLFSLSCSSGLSYFEVPLLPSNNQSMDLDKYIHLENLYTVLVFVLYSTLMTIAFRLHYFRNPTSLSAVE